MDKKGFSKKIANHEGVVDRAQPFSIVSESAKDSLVIIVHGFTSSPYHMHNIADWLAEHGYDVETVLLAGHGGSFERLQNASADDWQESLDKVVEKNIVKYNKIFLLGFSFGANLVLHASLKYPQIKAVTVLSIPIFLKKEKRIRFFLPLANIFQKKYRKRWIAKEHWLSLEERGHHSHIPIKGIVDFYGFIDNVTKKEIKEINIPILIIHSRGDTVTMATSSEFLYKNIKSKIKEIYILDKASHNLEFETRRDFFFTKIVAFFDSF